MERQARIAILALLSIVRQAPDAFAGSSAGADFAGSALALPSITMDGGPLAIVSLYKSMPPNYAGMSGAGPVYSIGCLSTACPRSDGQPYDSQRAQQFIRTTTQADATKQEYSAFLHMDALTGRAPFWTPNTRYPAKAQVSNHSDVYTAGAACVSGSRGGPGGTGVSRDGNCAWTFGGENTNGKTTLGISMYSGPNSGSAWGEAISATRVGGDPTRFSAGLEVDNTIADGVDHVPGTPTGGAYGVIQSGFNGAGSIGTIANAISTANKAGAYAWHCAFCVIAANAAKDTGFGNGSNAADGFSNNAVSNASGGFHDAGGTSARPNPLGFYATGYYGAAAFDATGAHTGNAFRAIAGQKVCFDVDDACLREADGKFQFVRGGRVGFLVDEGGGLRASGTVSSSSATPTVARCGQGAVIAGTSQSGVVTVGTGPVKACTVVLAAAIAAPFAGCVLTPANPTAARPAVGAYAALADRTTTSWIIRGAELAGAAFNYLCM